MPPLEVFVPSLIIMVSETPGALLLFQRYVQPGLLVAGIAGNLISLAVFAGSGKLRSRSMFKSLLVLTASDLAYLAHHVVVDLLSIGEAKMVWWDWRPLSMASSLYATAIISVERYLGVCKPFYPHRGRVQTALLCSAAVLNVLLAALLHAYGDSLKLDAAGAFAFAFALCHRLAPLVVMTVLSCLIILEIRRSRRLQLQAHVDKAAIRTTKMLLVVILLSPLCHLVTTL